MDSQLKEHLEALETTAGNRVYPVVRPQKSPVPALTYQLISEPRTLTHSGADNLVEARYQITAWASSHLAMRELRAAVREELHGFRGNMGGVNISNIRAEGGSDQYEPGADGEPGKAGVHYGPADYIIQYSE